MRQRSIASVLVLALSVGVLTGCQPKPEANSSPYSSQTPQAPTTAPAAGNTTQTAAAPLQTGGTLDPASKKLFDEAVAHSKKREFAAAIDGYNKVLTLVPNHADSLANLGWMYAETKSWEMAKTNLEKALAINPNHVDALSNLGWVYAEEKNWDKAQEFVSKAVAINPKHAGAFTNLGWIYAEKGMFDASAGASRQAIALNPGNAYAHANLGWALKGAKKIPEAMAEYTKALSLNPNMPDAQLAIGTMYCEQGSHDKAKEVSAKLSGMDTEKAGQLNGKIAKGCGKKK